MDRLELENQAWKNFNAYLANDGISTVIYKQKRRDWMQAQVVVTTIQSLAARNRFLHEFAPTDFQLIISDEAHRTINGNNRTIFEYFVGAKLGLTATPRDYLKGLKDKDRRNDPREYERRLLLDTYRTFGSDDGKPTFRYTLLDAVQHVPPYLCTPVTLDARTDITTQMLSDEGYTVTVPANEDGQEQELVFEKRDYERKFFSDETNLSFVRCFLDNAKCDPLTGEVGKTIMFAVSRKHATKLVTLLNEKTTRCWPKEYAAGSTFAVQVTSDIPGAQQASEAVASDPVLRQAYDEEDWPAVEERVRRLLFEKPEEFWNLPKLQEIYKTDRLPSLREILARVFGLIPEIPTRGQLADEAFERFITTQETNATHSRELRMVFVAFLLDAQSRMLLEEGRFAELRARDASLFGSLSQLSPQEREALIGYLQSQVPIQEFEQVA